MFTGAGIVGREHAKTDVAVPWSAIFALLLGSLVYVSDRDWGTAMFLAPVATLQPGRAGLFGPLGGSLPSFLHAYAFALLLIVVVGNSKVARVVCAYAWFLCAAGLELLQWSPVQRLALDAGPLFDSPAPMYWIRSYIVFGDFDPGDIAAAALGCAAAWAVSSVRELRQ